MFLRRSTYKKLKQSYQEKIKQEIEQLLNFTDTDILLYWNQIKRGINLHRMKKIVDLKIIRDLYIGLIAIEETMRQRMR